MTPIIEKFRNKHGMPAAVRVTERIGEQFHVSVTDLVWEGLLRGQTEQFIDAIIHELFSTLPTN